MSENSIEVLIKALGTMIEVPQWEKEDPNNIGSKKVIVGVYREPIITGKDREKVKDKLVELVEAISPY